VIEVTANYALRGPLAQFGRPAIVRLFAGELTQQVARNLDARLTCGHSAAAPRLGLGRLLLKLIWARLARRRRATTA
jgi:carbon-monoxide dehydrogenase small subunit